MAGYADKRDENYEIKYLRKVLGQVDNRIRVPQSLDAQSLLPLLDGIESSSYETARRRPRWISLQSGVAYAAAFALIVALFYSMELYRPQMLEGGMLVAESSQSAQALLAEDAADAGGDVQPETDLILVGDDSGDLSGEAVPDTALPSQAGGIAEAAPVTAAFGIGGVESNLLLEQDNTAYYCRVNDSTDPDRQAPVTLEIVDTASQELVSQIDISEMSAIDRCFVAENLLLLVGQNEDAVVISTYDNTDPASPAEMSSLARQGELVDARAYKDVVHVVSFSAEPENAVTLPNAAYEDCLVITAYNTETSESYTRSFIGAKGTVQLHNLNAYIHYEGESEDGEAKDYIAQILLDGMDIELTTVS